jgi:hypothetical protein
LVCIFKQALVPEHTESRSLRRNDLPNFVQGKLEMWIDIFRYNELLQPKPVDIKPPEPVKLQLRVVIKNTKEVYLDDVNPLNGERTSDIYVKGWVGDTQIDLQKTDTHFKSRTGEGNFNWRFVFDFEYLLDEKKVVVNNQSWFGKIKYKEEPILHLEVWDADYLTKDDFIGQIKFNLLSFMQGTKMPKTCDFKRIYSKEWPKFNLFEAQNVSGWWPFLDNENEKMMVTKDHLLII